MTAADPDAFRLLDRTGVCGARLGTLSQREKVTGRAFDRPIGSTKRGDRYADCRIRIGFAFDRRGPLPSRSGGLKPAPSETTAPLAYLPRANRPAAPRRAPWTGRRGGGIVAPLRWRLPPSAAAAPLLRRTGRTTGHGGGRRAAVARFRVSSGTPNRLPLRQRHGTTPNYRAPAVVVGLTARYSSAMGREVAVHLPLRVPRHGDWSYWGLVRAKRWDPGGVTGLIAPENRPLSTGCYDWVGLKDFTRISSVTTRSGAARTARSG